MTFFCNLNIFCYHVCMFTEMRASEALFQTRYDHYYSTICTSSHSLGQFGDHILKFLVTISLYNLTVLSNDSALKLPTALLFTLLSEQPDMQNCRTMAALPLGILKHMEKDGVLVVLHQLRPRCMDGRYLPHRVPLCGAVGGEERCGPQRTAPTHGRRCVRRK